MSAEDSPLISDVVMVNDEETACIATPKDGVLDDYDEKVFRLEYLKWAVEQAEKMGWEKVCLNTKEDYPLFMKAESDDVDTSLIVYPWFLDGDES